MEPNQPDSRKRWTWRDTMDCILLAWLIIVAIFICGALMSTPVTECHICVP